LHRRCCSASYSGARTNSRCSGALVLAGNDLRPARGGD
jgi:hypothetical protein